MIPAGIDVRNPFPGLRPFGETESDIFFGQDSQVEELFERLGDARFVGVLGVSGCGKSSLVRAGLIPILVGTNSAGDPPWYVVTCRPGSSPIANLARALAKRIPGSAGPADAEASLRRHSLGLADYPSGTLKPCQRILVVVDQFEELFTYRQESPTAEKGDEAALFVKLLLAAASEPASRMYVVITMRSEYIGDCAQFYGLSEAVNSGLYLLPKMSRQQCAEVITGPVTRRSATITPQLVQELLNETEEREDGLPLLQHALRRIWEAWAEEGSSETPIGIEHFQLPDSKASAPLIDQHLDRHLDSLYGELSAERKRIAKFMFKLITDRDAKGREIRRPASLSEMEAVTGAVRWDIEGVIEHFRNEERGRTFLAPRTDEPGEKVDLSHECLMRRWAQLRLWMREEQQDKEQFRRLAEAADRYEQGLGSELTGRDLESVDRWEKAFRPTAGWASRYVGEEDEDLGRRRREFGSAARFLQRSRERKQVEDLAKRREEEDQERQKIAVASAEARAEAAEAKAQLEREEARRKRRLAWLYSLAALVALVVAGGVAVVMSGLRAQAVHQRNKAEAERASAEKQKRIADAQTTLAQEETAKAQKAEGRVQSAVIDVKKQAERLRLANARLQVEEGNAVTANNQLKAKSEESEARRVESEQAGNQLKTALTDLNQQAKRLEDQGKELASQNATLKAQADHARSVAEADRFVAASESAKTPELALAYATEALRILLKGFTTGDFTQAAQFTGGRAYHAVGHALQRPLLMAHRNFPTHISSIAYKEDEKGLIGIGVNRQKFTEMVDSSGKTWSYQTIRYPGRGIGKVPAFLLRRTEADLAQAVALSSDAHLAAEGTSEGYMFTFAPFTEDYNRSRPRTYPITVLAFSPGAKSLAAATGAGGWSIFDVASRKDLAHDDSRDLTITHMALSDGPDWLAYATLQGTVRAVNAKNHAAIEVGTMPWVRGLDITGDGRLVIASDESDRSSQCLSMVDLNPKAKTQAIRHSLCSPDPFTAVAFSPSRALLGAATRSGTVEIWDTKTFARAAEFTGLPNGIIQLRFNPGESSFTILAEAGEGQVWPVSVKPGQLKPWQFYTTPTSAAQLASDLKTLEPKSGSLTEQARKAVLEGLPYDD